MFTCGWMSQGTIVTILFLFLNITNTCFHRKPRDKFVQSIILTIPKFLSKQELSQERMEKPYSLAHYNLQAMSKVSS